jgi:Arc/MetJ-type ribon-helix-helix transcriptional regulator
VDRATLTLTLSPELEQRIDDLVSRGEYPDADAVLADAVESLVRERERHEVERTFKDSGLIDAQLEALMGEAGNSGPHEEMTAQDWADIEREGIDLLRSRSAR